MTKKQKIWLWVFIALFLVPEILWSPVLNFSFSILENSNSPTIIRESLLTESDNRILTLFVLAVQIISLMGVFKIVVKSNFTIGQKILFVIPTVMFILITGSIFILLFLFRRGIGF